MFKHPWLLKNYTFSAANEGERAAEKIYWTCFLLAALLFGAYGFAINYLELMNKTVRALSLPSGIMFATMVILMGHWIHDTLSRIGKLIAGPTALLVMVLVSNTVWLLLSQN